MANDDAIRLITLEIADLMARAVAEVGANADRLLIAFGEGMRIGARGDMQRVHREIAADVRRNVRQAYEASVEDVRLVPSYKRSGRDAGGLGRAIRRNDLARADADSIEFVNDDALDKEAAHWWRLNFGAGKVAGPQRPAYPVRIFGQTLANLDFGGGPSTPFALPPGFFVQSVKGAGRRAARGAGTSSIPRAEFRGQGTRAAFVPHSKSPYRPAITEGIRGRHFLEVGLETIARELPIKYEDLINEWIQQGGRKAKAIRKVTTIR